MEENLSIKTQFVQQMEAKSDMDLKFQKLTKNLDIANRELDMKSEALLEVENSNKRLVEDNNLLTAQNQTLFQDLQTLRLRNYELKENNLQLASFSSNASHDLQEPLRKIHLFCSIIFQDYDASLSTEVKDYLKRIMASSTRMQRLIDDLLTYSEVNSLRKEDFVKTDLAQLFNDSIEVLDERIQANNAVIEMGPLPDIYLITALVRQVFSNLVSNSLKYRDENRTPIISVSSTTADRSDFEKFQGNLLKLYYKITISDNGMGFTQDQSTDIFEPFVRLHSKDRYEGSGIGLAICKKIMIRHGGDIVASGEPGKGSNFYLYFPAVQDGTQTNRKPQLSV